MSLGEVWKTNWRNFSASFEWLTSLCGRWSEFAVDVRSLVEAEPTKNLAGFLGTVRDAGVGMEAADLAFPQVRWMGCQPVMIQRDFEPS